MRSLCLALGLIVLASNENNAQPTDAQLRSDWANLAKYRDANAKVTPPAANENRVVFMVIKIEGGKHSYDLNYTLGTP